jgi:hypothetical protein
MESNYHSRIDLSLIPGTSTECWYWYWYGCTVTGTGYRYKILIFLCESPLDETMSRLLHIALLILALTLLSTFLMGQVEIIDLVAMTTTKSQVGGGQSKVERNYSASIGSMLATTTGRMMVRLMKQWRAIRIIRLAQRHPSPLYFHQPRTFIR